MLPAHPYGVEPEDNAYYLNDDRDWVERRKRSLGALSMLTDALLLDLLAVVDATGLALLGCCSTSLRAYASFEELWKGACMDKCRQTGAALRYVTRSWKRTFGGPSATMQLSPGRVVYSDLLYHAHDLAHASFFAEEQDDEDEQCAARLCDERGLLSGPEFEAGFEAPARPVVLRGCMRKEAEDPTWDESSLVARYGDHRFHSGGLGFGLRDFLSYSRDNADDQPLYIFDKKFAETAPELAEAYKPPFYFQDDLFARLPNRRPDHRWLILGGARSGSKWHKDPNATSAWNATLRGSKRWFFSPPECPPPGVTPSEDGLEVTQPQSIAEWIRGFLDQAREEGSLIEATTGPGDVVFVPRGWWHCVLNLEPFTLALTHNFCSPRGLAATMRLLRTTPSLVSGIHTDREHDGDRAELGRKLLSDLLGTLAEERPGVLQRAEAQLLAPSLWASLTSLPPPPVDNNKRHKKDDDRGGGPATAPAAFSFGFTVPQ